MQRVAELVRDCDYDLCVLTGDYRGRTHGDCEPCLEVMAHLCEGLRGVIYGVLGNHDSIAMVPDLEAFGVRMLLNESVAIRFGADLDLSRGVCTTRISTCTWTTSKKQRRTLHMAVSLSCFLILQKSTGRPPTPVLT